MLPSFADMLAKMRTLPHKECFAVFLTCYSKSDHQVKICFHGILNLNGKNTTQFRDIMKFFFEFKQIILYKVLLSVFDGTNAMSGKEGGVKGQCNVQLSVFIAVIIVCCNSLL